MNIVLGITGSVSAYKTPWLIRDLLRARHVVRVVMTHSAKAFVAPLALEATSMHKVVVDAFARDIQEGGSWHVHLAQWADAMLIAPCSASTLARLATAQCDNSVSLVACSLPNDTPLLVAPAMDTDMWTHPATQRNVALLMQDGVRIIPPESGSLASGLEGAGRLPELDTIVSVVNDHQLQNVQVLDARNLNHVEANTKRPLSVVVTAGPTHERIDPVRSIVNHSTGTMGFALAEAAAQRGMLVTLIAGPVTLDTPSGVQRIDVTTAEEMFTAVQQHKQADIVVMAAAVADFTIASPLASKIKKDTNNVNGLTLELVRTNDILAYLGSTKTPTQVVVGFALETDKLIANARKKLSQKQADMIIANQAGMHNSGFGSGMNTITIVKQETEAPYPPMSKRACAEVVLDAALEQWHSKQKDTDNNE